jgi:hypothetical protein
VNGLPARIAELFVQQARRRLPGWLVSELEADVPAGDVEIEALSASTVRIRKGDEAVEVRVQIVPPRPKPTALTAWRPPSLRRARAPLEQLSYVVVDEIVADGVRLSVSDWPQVDERGRLHFEEGGTLSVEADLGELVDFLAGARRDGRRRMEVRMGTVLAAKVKRAALRRSAPHPGDWLVPPVYDVSADARTKAKEAFYAAVTPTLKGRRGR